MKTNILLKKHGVDIARLPKKKPKMTQRRYEDLCYMFHDCGYSVRELRRRAAELNSGVIKVCEQCGRFDISMSHWRTCNPALEQYRRDNEDCFYK